MLTDLLSSDNSQFAKQLVRRDNANCKCQLCPGNLQNYKYQLPRIFQATGTVLDLQNCNYQLKSCFQHETWLSVTCSCKTINPTTPDLPDSRMSGSCAASRAHGFRRDSARYAQSAPFFGALFSASGFVLS